jgi:hypothetical protein
MVSVDFLGPDVWFFKMFFHVAESSKWNITMNENQNNLNSLHARNQKTGGGHILTHAQSSGITINYLNIYFLGSSPMHNLFRMKTDFMFLCSKIITCFCSVKL